MPQLKCREMGCAHNYCAHCVKDIIKVNKDAVCVSHDSKNEVNQESAKYEYEFACDIGLATEADMHHILCDDVKCRYNMVGECELRSLRIERSTNGPLCANFRPR